MQVRRSYLGIAALLISLGVAVPTAQSASAASSPTCPSNYACLWRDIHYETAGSTTHSYSVYTAISDMFGHHYTGTTYSAAQSASSSDNEDEFGNAMNWYKSSGCQGVDYVDYAQVSDADFTNGTPSGNYNDAIVSGAYQVDIGDC